MLLKRKLEEWTVYSNMIYKLPKTRLNKRIGMVTFFVNKMI